MTAQKTTVSKSDFIRAQPATMSAIDLIEKAKAAGVKLTTSYIYNVRTEARAEKTSKGVKPGAAGAGSKGSAKPSKAGFVRAHTSLSPNEIVAKAKAAGIKLDVGYVYNVRGADKKAGGRKEMRTAARRSTTSARPAARPVATASNAENLLRAVAAEVGLGRAIELLEAERAHLHAILRG